MEPDRSSVDPQGRYGDAGLTEVEQHALVVLELLPGATFERTRDVFQIEQGGEEGIVVLVTPDALEIRLPTMEWTQGSYGPASGSRLWKRARWGRGTNDISGLLRKAHRAREAEYVACRHCGVRFPPERRVRDACHGCAERHDGITF